MPSVLRLLSIGLIRYLAGDIGPITSSRSAITKAAWMPLDRWPQLGLKGIRGRVPSNNAVTTVSRVIVMLAILMRMAIPDTTQFPFHAIARLAVREQAHCQRNSYLPL